MIIDNKQRKIHLDVVQYDIDVHLCIHLAAVVYQRKSGAERWRDASLEQHLCIIIHCIMSRSDGVLEF